MSGITDAVTAGEQKQTPPTGLDEVSRIELFTAGRLQRFDAGEIRVTADSEESWYLVKSGQLNVGPYSGSPDPGLVTVEEGSWIAAGTGRLYASEPCTLMEVKRSSLEQLSPAIRIEAYGSATQTLVGVNGSLDASLSLGQGELAGVKASIDRYQCDREALVNSPPVEAFLAELPALPPSASLIIHSGEQESMENVVQAVKNDPGLAGLVLKVGNSAAFERGFKIADLQRVCLHLGSVRVYQLVLQHMVGKILPVDESQKELQDHAALIAAASTEIALLAFKKNTQIENTIGLLHHVGAAAASTLRSKHPEHAWLAGLLNHALLGAKLLKVWQLPERVVHAVRAQDVPQNLPPDDLGADERVDLAVLHTAHACVEHLTAQGEDFEGAFLNEYFSLLKLPYKTPAAFADKYLRSRLGARLPDHLRSRLDSTMEAPAQLSA